MIDIWEEGHVEQKDDIEEDPAELMLDLAIETFDHTNGIKNSPGRITKLKDGGLYNRSKVLPLLSAVAGVICFV